MDGSAETLQNHPQSPLIIMTTITRPFRLEFTEDELETISSALGEYILHDEPDADPEELIGGISVAERCDSIQMKISRAFNIREMADQVEE